MNNNIKKNVIAGFIGCCVIDKIADSIYPNDDNSNDSIDGYYVDGVSITHGNNPRKHIWTYICGQYEQRTNYQNCPCNNGSKATLPSYVGNDYYYESSGIKHRRPNKFFTDVLWDGQIVQVLRPPVVLLPKCLGS